MLYIPALNSNLAVKLINSDNPFLTSIAFCLEDAVLDTALADAERSLVKTMKYLLSEYEGGKNLPLLFIRVRTPEHLNRIHKSLGNLTSALTGYIFPKFDGTNISEYIKLLIDFNGQIENTIYFMPILETKPIADILTRAAELNKIKAALEPVKSFVINIRVGGNDFSNLYGLRRGVNQTIYDIAVIKNILSDIVNVFGTEYIVSGPCWEYFGTDDGSDWINGLNKELELDKLNGFTGKTAIHPSQLKYIYENMKVNQKDYQDAKNILKWDSESIGVARSADGTRMNEVNCHGKWAAKICSLAKLYGVKDVN